MKKAFVLLIVFSLLSFTGLAACGGTQAPDSSHSSDPSATGSSVEPSSESSAAEGPSQAAPIDAARQAALEAKAQEILTAMQNGAFDTVAGQFNEDMAAALTADALQSGWDSTLAPLGDHIGHISTESQALEQDAFLIVMLEKYENNGLLLQISFDSSDRIQGLFITYRDVSGLDPSAPSEETVTADGFTEVPVTITANPAYPLNGTLTLPVDTVNPPVVILVHGSGSSDQNETLYGNTPFQDIAHGLAGMGVASLRYDKRYYAYPEAAAAPSSLTVEAEVLEDVDAAISLAMNDSRLDHSRVYVLGHSLGGMLTPSIAASHPELAGIISMAGSLRPLWEISYDQNQEAAAAVRDTLSEADRQLLDSQLATVEADVAALRELWESGQLTDPSFPPDTIEEDTAWLGIPAAYWASLARNDGTLFLDRITMPILILQGDADFQVYPDRDYVLWQEALSGRENAEFHLYEGLNHLMMATQGKRDISEYAVKSKVSEEVIADIADFVK